jgi:hypothetical protein
MFNKVCIRWWKEFNIIKMDGATIKIKKKIVCRYLDRYLILCRSLLDVIIHIFRHY